MPHSDNVLKNNDELLNDDALANDDVLANDDNLAHEDMLVMEVQQPDAAFCSICQDYPVVAAHTAASAATFGLQCNHVFCIGCIHKWCAKEKSCPNCRSNIPGTVRMAICLKATTVDVGSMTSYLHDDIGCD